jgi:hypothetical protein
VILLQAAPGELWRVDVEHGAAVAIDEDRVAVDRAPAVVEGDPHQAAAVQAGAKVGERGLTVLRSHPGAEGAQLSCRETLAAVLLQSMSGPVLLPRGVPLLMVVASQVLEALLQEPLRLVGTD